MLSIVSSIGLDAMIKKELDIVVDKTVFWTDSMTVHKYIRNKNKRFQTFVANRLSVIHDGSTPEQWRHVDTKHNPTDDASRGLSADDLLQNERWIKGPKFLWQSEEYFPSMDESSGEVAEDDLEVKRSRATTFVTSAIPLTNVLGDVLVKFSSWNKLRRIVAWMLRYRVRLLQACEARKKTKPTEHAEKNLEPLTVEEIELAEREILMAVQGERYAEEIHDHEEENSRRESRKSTIEEILRIKKTSSIYKLDPILKNGLICVSGRLKNAPIHDKAKSPVVLPNRHFVTNLIINHLHLVSGHLGLEYTLSLVREKYWVVKGRAAVKGVLRHCFSCRKRQSRVGEPKMSNIPMDRVTPGQPFQIKRGRTIVKRYGVLFTCLNIRAVQTEVAHSMDTTSFIEATRRFIARRGNPTQVRSDNGGNFVGAEKELREAVDGWNQQQIHDELLQRNIKWIFNPPAASHHGGVWERCIRTVRKVMNALLKEQMMTDEGLSTLMCEVESIINGRPITKVSDDPHDLEALTPNHLLLLRSGPKLPPGVFLKEHMYCRRRWRQTQYLVMYSGDVGLKNTFHLYSRDNVGPDQGGILLLMTSC